MDLELIFRFALLGLGVGGVYALSAVGIVSVHRGSKTVNFAHAGIALWASHVFYSFRDSYNVPTPVALPLTVALACAFGVVVYVVVIRPIRHRTQLTRMVATLGLLGFLNGMANSLFKKAPRVPSGILPQSTSTILGQKLPTERIDIFLIAVGLGAGLALWSSRARLPLMTKAMAEHEPAAQALGASPHTLGAFNWAIGSALAGLSGILVAPIIGQVDVTMVTVMSFAMAAALVGRFDSYWIALIAGLGLGVGESVVTHLVAEHVPQRFQNGWPQTVPFVAVMAILLIQRDRASNRLPAAPAAPVAAGLFKPIPVAGLLVGISLLLLFGSNQWADAATVSIMFAILVLSLVMLIGYANQISLAQMTVAGLGAYVAARLDIDFNLPFVLAPLVGAVVGALAGLVVGLPALRVRGTNLAILTMGMAIAASAVLFDSSHFTGGISGTTPHSPTLFGWDIDASRHPSRYGLFCLFWLIIAGVVVALVRRGRLGRQLLVVRTNERAAASVGIHITRAKLSAFVISSSLAGCAGVLLSFRRATITFSSFSFIESINVVALAVICGVASISGGILGGIAAHGGIVWLLIAQRHVNLISNNFPTIFGIGLVVTILVHENGVAWRKGAQNDPTPVPEGHAEGRAGAPLVVRGASVHFGGVKAAMDVHLRAEPGSVTGLVGPNGAGKTTVLDAIGGFASMSEGDVLIGDTVLTHLPPSARADAGVGRVFQAGELFEDLTIAQNLRVAAENAGATDGRLPEPARAAVERFGLTDDLGRLPTQVSMAKRRFVGIARALAANPAVLLLDEPGAGLSITEISELASTLRGLAHETGLAVLIVDHDMALVMSACDQIVVLHGGRVLTTGTPQEVQNDPRVQAAYLGGESDTPPSSAERPAPEPVS